MKILIVDDNPTNLKLLRAQLEAEGHAVIAASDGAEGLARLERDPVDAIISDILMPQMDGYRFCHEVRMNQRFAHLPFIVFTATYTSPSDEELAMQVGADKYLRKPAQLDEIVAALDEVSKRTWTRRGGFEAVLPEVDLLKQYSERLVNKLEEKNTELSAAVEQLRMSEERLQTIVETEPECVKIVSPEGRLLEMNSAGLAMLEAETFDRVSALPLIDLVIPEHRAAFGRLHRRVMQGESGTLEFDVVGLKGTRRRLETHATPLRDKQGKVTSLLGITRDVTARWLAERELNEKAFLLAESQRIGAIGTWSWELPENNIRWSEEAYRVLGVSPQTFALTPTSFVDLIHGEDRSAIQEWIRACRSGERPGEIEFRVILSDGTLRLVSGRGELIAATGSSHARMVGTVQDVTERKQGERQIRKLNRTYAVLGEINQLIVRERERQAILDGACRIAVEKGEFRMAWIGLLSPETQRVRPVASAGMVQGYLERVDIALKGDIQGRGPTSVALRTGEPQVCNDTAGAAAIEPWREAALQRGYFSSAAFPLKVGGRTVGTFNLYASEAGFFDAEELRLLGELAEDIAFALEGCEREGERQHALEELRASEERFRELAETIQEVFWVTDLAKTKMVYISPAYEKIWGHSCQTLYERPQTWLDAIHPEDRPRILEAATTRQTEGTYDEEYRIVRPDGEVRWIRDRAFPVRNAAGQAERVVGVARDVTDRRQLEEQFRQAQKMEALGTLAGGIAHDFNNILGAIIGNVELARQDVAADHPATESLTEIHKASQRAKDLVERILAIGRRQQQPQTVIELRPVVEDVVALLRRTLPAGVELVTAFDAGTPFARADPTQIHQALMNLCTNAWHAMDGGSGRIDIRLDGVTLDPEAARAVENVRPGRFVRLSVADNGSGIDAATQERIFEPFFTTKAVGKGTGLGLSVVHGIARSHGGAITVASQPGAGATFVLYLPAADATPPAAVPEVAADDSPAAVGRRILYLDDEQPLVSLVKRTLERLGHRVSGYTRAEEALAAVRVDPGGFDLVIADLNMPGASGLDVARELARLRPDLPVVLTSGCVSDDLRVAAGEAGVRRLVSKPTTVEELRSVVEELANAVRPV